MSWNRSVRLPATISLTLALALGALVAPALVAAKPAPLEFGVGPGFIPSTATGALPTVVSPGEKVSFEVWARNKGGSNISKLFLTARTSATFVSAIVSNTGGTAGSCLPGPAGIGMRCTWKPFKPGASVRVRMVLSAPASGTTLPVMFEWSSTGYVTGGNNSHGDLFHQSDIAGVNGNTDVFAGRYLQPGDDKVVKTKQLLDEGNPQSTLINAPTDNNIGVTAGEDEDISDCTEFFGEENTCFGQAAIINVNNGQTFPGGFTVELVYLGEFPEAQFIHFPDAGTPVEIDACGETPVPDCFELSVGEGYTFVTLHLTQNGKTFGH